MGGAIGITLIKPNGETLKMCRSTGSYPSFVQHIKFVEKDEEHIEKFLKYWRKMKKDWERYGPNGPFEHDGTDYFLPFNEMAPVGYGLIVIDMQKDKIYSCQGYCRVDHRYYDPLMEISEPDEFVGLETLRKNNRLTMKHKFRLKSSMVDIDLSPFLVFNFSEGSEGLIQMKEILQREYGLSTKEIEMWNESIAQYQEDDEEEDE